MVVEREVGEACAPVVDSRSTGLLADGVRVVFDTAFEALLVVDEGGSYVHVNHPATQLLGAPAADVLRRRVGHFTPPELRPALRRLWNAGCRDGVVHGPSQVLRPDGSRIAIEFRATRDFADGRHLIAAREVGALNATGSRLTPRELEVLQLASHGHTPERIADGLVISPATVKKHLERSYRKLEVRDRVAAVAEGLRRGLIR